MNIQVISNLLQTILQWLTLYVYHFSCVSIHLWNKLLEVELLGQKVNAFIIDRYGQIAFCWLAAAAYDLTQCLALITFSIFC